VKKILALCFKISRRSDIACFEQKAPLRPIFSQELSFESTKSFQEKVVGFILSKNKIFNRKRQLKFIAN